VTQSQTHILVHTRTSEVDARTKKKSTYGERGGRRDGGKQAGKPQELLLWRRVSAFYHAVVVRGLSPKAVCDMSEKRRGFLCVSFDCDSLSEKLEGRKQREILLGDL